MKKILSIIVIVLLGGSIALATSQDRRCYDSKKIIQNISYQKRNINKIRAECENVISLKHMLKKRTGFSNLKTRKTLPLNTLKRVVTLVKAENVKISRVTHSYRSINKYAVALRKNILLLSKKITRITEKWKKQNLLKYKKNCLILLNSQVRELNSEVKKIRLTSFSYGNKPLLSLRRFTPGRSDNSGYKQDEEKIFIKRWEAMESIADAEIDEAKNNYEAAKEQFKLAMRILQEHMERMTQVTQKITS